MTNVAFSGTLTLAQCTLSASFLSHPPIGCPILPGLPKKGVKVAEFGREVQKRRSQAVAT